MSNRCINKVSIYKSLLSSYGVEIFAGYNISQKKLEAIFLTKLMTSKLYDRNVRGGGGGGGERIQISLIKAPLRKKAHGIVMQGDSSSHDAIILCELLSNQMSYAKKCLDFQTCLENVSD